MEYKAGGRRVLSKGVESRFADILDHGEHGKKEMIVDGDNSGIGEDAIVVLVEDRGRRGFVEVEAAANHEQGEGGDYMIWSILEAKVGMVVVEEEKKGKERLRVERRTSRCHCHSLLPFFFGITTAATYLLHPYHSLSSTDLTYDPNATLSRHPPPPPISSATLMLPSFCSSNFTHDRDSTPSPYRLLPSPPRISLVTLMLLSSSSSSLLFSVRSSPPATSPGPTNEGHWGCEGRKYLPKVTILRNITCICHCI